MNHTVGISDMKLSNRTEDMLVTYALGSCVGVSIFDPVAGVGGLIHCMLPLSKIDRDKAAANPCMFVDTGIPKLFLDAYRLGAQKDRMVVKVAGGSQIHDDQGRFRIGERNYATLRKILWKNNVLIGGEDIGGSISRTVYLEMDTGRTLLKVNGDIREL